MTRINLVHPSRLADQHLFAEWREIKHIPAFLNQLLAKGKSIEEIKAKIPEKFCLNTGHKYFFVDKLKFLSGRFWKILAELDAREYKTFSGAPWEWEYSLEKIPDEYFNDYVPDYIALELSEQRLLERIDQRPNWYRYKGEIKDLQFFKDLLYSK
jgi:deoxyribonuclease (pyrimidine dimer)